MPKFSTSEQNIFFTSDTHFYHDNIIKYCNRPFSSVEEMNETIINNWNNVVGDNDIIFHLGDFSFCGVKQFEEIVARLKGRIYLIIGNHDFKNLARTTMHNRFEEIHQQMYIRVDGQPMYLNHFPYLCYGGAYRELDRCIWQLFGHVHSSPNTQTGIDVQRMIHLLPTQYDVGVDNNNYTPVSFKKVKEIITNQVMSLNMHRGE